MPCIWWFLNSLKTSKRDAAVLQVPNNFVVAKKPLPLEPWNSLKKTDFFNNLLAFDCFHPVENILNCLFDAGDAFLLGFYEAVGPVDDVHGVEGEYHFGQPS